MKSRSSGKYSSVWLQVGYSTPPKIINSSLQGALTSEIESHQWNMEGIELEMTKEELHKWIREKVTNNALVVDMMETSSLLQSLLERRENEAVHLLQLCRSVAACEAAVRKHYVLLGWEYKETDSDDDNNVTGCAKTPPSAHEFAQSESEEPNYPSTKSPSPVLSNVEDNANLGGRKAIINLTRQPVVVLNRLPPCKIKSLCRPTPQSFDSEDDVSKNSDSESLWEPHEDSSDSDFAVSSFKSKRRKLHQENEKLNKISQPADSKSKAGNAPQANTAARGQRNPVKVPKLPASARENRNAAESSTLLAKSNNQGVAVSTLRSSGKFTKTQNACNTQEGQICVDLNVLARSRTTGWQMGTIVEIVTKEDGRVKYKISFAANRRSLVSGHHMAFGSAPKLDQLDVGTRVVVRREGATPLYSPATVAEVPSQKNQMRFLVFFDDHTPCYVSLPSLHLVCKPLDDPLDDIANEHHRNFMKGYRRDWPYPPWIHYKVGQIINAERNGVQQRCVVEVVDCSLIQVLFQKDQHKDWIYRGSTRLEYIIIMRKKSLLKK